MVDFEGRVALVTGGSRGIGAAIARRLAAAGASVAVAARTLEPGQHRFPGSLSDTVRAIVDDGGRAIPLPVDLTSPAENLVEAVRAATDQLGPIDVLVNNAGVALPAGFAETTAKHLDLCYQVNVRAPWLLAQAVLPGMQERGAGWIVNLTSFMGQADAAREVSGPTGVGLAYGTSKAALDHWTKVYGAASGPGGIALNAVSPLVAVGTAAASDLDEFDSATAEPVEVLVEAVLALASCDAPRCSGRVVSSQELLVELDRPVRDLAGRQLVAGWQPSDLALGRTEA